MADRIFERILQQTAADVAAEQEQADPEAQKRKAQVRWRRERPLPAHVGCGLLVSDGHCTHSAAAGANCACFMCAACCRCICTPTQAFRRARSLPHPPHPGSAGHPLLMPSLLPLCLPQVSEEASLRKMTTGMTASDAIKRMLLAYKDRDYFR